MIRNWLHRGLKRFYETGSMAGIQPKHAENLRYLLFQLANATCPSDMNTPGNDFHPLSGELKGYYAVKVNTNWRLTFQFIGSDAINVDYVDYH